MDERQATELAAKVGGEAWHSGGGIWLVLADRPGGVVRVISDDMDNVYESREAFRRGDEPVDVHITDGE